MIRSGWLLSAPVSCLVIGAAIAAAWSGRTWTATAVLRIVPQQIPERYVAAQTADAERLLPSIMQTVTSRGNLFNITKIYSLYPDEDTVPPADQMVKRMRAAIQVAPAASGTFTVSFSYPQSSTGAESHDRSDKQDADRVYANSHHAGAVDDPIHERSG